MDGKSNREKAWDEFQEVTLPKLEKLGRQIGMESMAGDDKAKAVIQAYVLLEKCFEQGAYALLVHALEEYETSRLGGAR